MSALGIFIFGVAVTLMVAGALGLLAWGLVNERRDRLNFEQGRDVYGARAAAFVTSKAEDPNGETETENSEKDPRRDAA